jgi:hypothetical protein
LVPKSAGQEVVAVSAGQAVVAILAAHEVVPVAAADAVVAALAAQGVVAPRAVDHLVRRRAVERLVRARAREIHRNAPSPSSLGAFRGLHERYVCPMDRWRAFAAHGSGGEAAMEFDETVSPK